LFETDGDRVVLHEGSGEKAGMNLQDRIAELEARNLYLQSLVVELLDKNEQLRRKVTKEKTGADPLSQ